VKTHLLPFLDRYFSLESSNSTPCPRTSLQLSADVFDFLFNAQRPLFNVLFFFSGFRSQVRSDDSALLAVGAAPPHVSGILAPPSSISREASSSLRQGASIPRLVRWFFSPP